MPIAEIRISPILLDLVICLNKLPRPWQLKFQCTSEKNFTQLPYPLSISVTVDFQSNKNCKLLNKQHPYVLLMELLTSMSLTILVYSRDMHQVMHPYKVLQSSLYFWNQRWSDRAKIEWSRLHSLNLTRISAFLDLQQWCLQINRK